MKRILGLGMAALLWSCSPDSGQGPFEQQATGFAALADTSTAPTARDSALATFPQDSGRCNYIEGEFNVPEAMEVIFGLYDREIECSRWVCKARELPSFAGKANQKGEVHTRAAGQFQFEQGGQKKAILLTATLSRDRAGWESCHACAPILGAAQFAEIDGAWFVEALKKDVTEIGSWGELPPSSLVQIGTDTWALAFDYGYTGQGTTLGGTMLVGFLDGAIKVVADIHTNYSNEGMFMEGEDDGFAYAYSSTISFQGGTEGAIKDMIVATTGRRPMDGLEGVGPVQRFQEQRTYVMKDDHYVLYDSVLIAN